MSYSWLLGVLVGAAFGICLVLVARRNAPRESDERLEAVQRDTSAIAFQLTAAFTLVAWLVDNGLAYLHGQPARVESPWSAMLAAMLFLYVGTRQFLLWQQAAWADLDAAERVKARRKAGVLFATVPAVIGSLRLSFEHGATGLGWVLAAFVLVQVVLGWFFLVQANRGAVDRRAPRH